MNPGAPLQPTLWRTCRALANRTRLSILDLLFQNPGQTVSTVAQRLKLPLSLTSLYLRTLEARGLLTVRRVGRRVAYRPAPTPAAEPATELVGALRQAFGQEANPIQTIFKAATAFTHPRRIAIFRALTKQGQTVEQLRALTRISVPALRRHLKKLEVRGFVGCEQGLWTVRPQPDALGCELARRAAGESG